MVKTKDRLSEGIIYNNIRDNANIDMEIKEGDIIKHFKFGRGIVEKVNFDELSCIIKFDTSREISAHIKLEKLN